MRYRVMHSRRLALVCLILSLVLIITLLPACSPDKVSDETVSAAAKTFAKLLKAAGKSADSAMTEIRKEAEKWGPKAQKFIEQVIAEMKRP